MHRADGSHPQGALAQCIWEVSTHSLLTACAAWVTVYASAGARASARAATGESGGGASSAASTKTSSSSVCATGITIPSGEGSWTTPYPWRGATCAAARPAARRRRRRAAEFPPTPCGAVEPLARFEFCAFRACVARCFPFSGTATQNLASRAPSALRRTDKEVREYLFGIASSKSATMPEKGVAIPVFVFFFPPGLNQIKSNKTRASDQA